MLRALMITGESTDLCGISDTFVFLTELEDEEMAKDAALEEFGDDMDSHLCDEYLSEEDLEEHPEPNFNYTAEFHTPEVYGDVNSPAYIKLN